MATEAKLRGGKPVAIARSRGIVVVAAPGCCTFRRMAGVRCGTATTACTLAHDWLDGDAPPTTPGLYRMQAGGGLDARCARRRRNPAAKPRRRGEGPACLTRLAGILRARWRRQVRGSARNAHRADGMAVKSWRPQMALLPPVPARVVDGICGHACLIAPAPAVQRTRARKPVKYGGCWQEVAIACLARRSRGTSSARGWLLLGAGTTSAGTSSVTRCSSHHRPVNDAHAVESCSPLAWWHGSPSVPGGRHRRHHRDVGERGPGGLRCWRVSGWCLFTRHAKARDAGRPDLNQCRGRGKRAEDPLRRLHHPHHPPAGREAFMGGGATPQ